VAYRQLGRAVNTPEDRIRFYKELGKLESLSKINSMQQKYENTTQNAQKQNRNNWLDCRSTKI